MTQRDLNRAVSRATGESMTTIRRIGFMVEPPLFHVDDPEDEDLGPHVLDWDVLLATDDAACAA